MYFNKLIIFSISIIFSFFISFAMENLTYNMKKSTLIILSAVLLCYVSCKNSSDPANWSKSETDKWFEKKEWLQGFAAMPDPSVNRKEFAVSYFKNRERWDKAFDFLKKSDLQNMEAKRYDIDGDALYATVSEYITKNEEDVKFEAHRKYIDIQCVIKGSEQMSITPLSLKKDIITEYDPSKDVEFMTVGQFSSYEATPGKFFIFFPSDIHRPSVKIGENLSVRKIVVKVRAD